MSVAIRPARLDELDRLCEIEDAAARIFEGREEATLLPDLGSSEPDGIREFAVAGSVFVAVDAADRPIGWAGMNEVDGEAHLFELDVDPAHGRHGLGRALVEHTAEWAADRGYASILLTTFREIPWNRPFYESAGYVVVEAGWGPGMDAVIAHQIENGLDFDERCVMRRVL